MAALAQIAGIASLPSASGADMREGDLLAVPQARHDLQRDRATSF
jgi:hypothetical protein